jgi:hypothetical protein
MADRYGFNPPRFSMWKAMQIGAGRLGRYAQQRAIDTARFTYNKFKEPLKMATGLYSAHRLENNFQRWRHPPQYKPHSHFNRGGTTMYQKKYKKKYKKYIRRS